ncbi:hypothetical protein GGR51DRAFT_576473 [Nemania sp. FL0031]|nr:hypothetical protein GGR51DRAFT_576473 [Nemania sp. FL0031]
MTSDSNLPPAHIKVDLPVYGDICSILFPEVKKGSATEWYVIWSPNQTLCDRYEAARYDACELRTELAELHSSMLLDCSTTKWTAPAIIHVPAASVTDYYPRPDTTTGAAPTVNMDKFWWWLIPLPLYLALFAINVHLLSTQPMQA